MKYIKTYEGLFSKIKKMFDTKYHDGDFVLTINDEVLKIYSTTIKKEVMQKPTVVYMGKRSNGEITSVDSDDIKSFATKEMIENYKLEKEAGKYNL